VRIAFKDHGATIDCTVRNLSNRGACLNVECSIGIPDSFDLVLDHASVRDCRVTWRKARQIGGPSAATAASEANAVINNFDMLPDTSQQDLLNFLRSL
jgi:hypothetical protein